MVIEGTSSGRLVDGGTWTQGHFCDVVDFHHGKITRLYIYRDPDHAGAARYPWLTANT